jgi:hypothetical protein
LILLLYVNQHINIWLSAKRRTIIPEFGMVLGVLFWLNAKRRTIILGFGMVDV